MMQKPLILITNDDSIHAPGLRKLIALVKDMGEIVVIASDSVMSGMAHAVTIKTPLRAKLIAESENYREYITNGTPADNVKLGKHKLLGRFPDLILSGINHGSNASVNIIYSGTMGAVLEGAIDNIPGIGFSLDAYNHDAPMDHFDDHLRNIVRFVLDNGLSKGTCFNVNIPAKNEHPVKGIKICRQADARWVEEFEERNDPHGGTYYWLAGRFENGDGRPDTDQKAIDNNYISVVPANVDFTAHDVVDELSGLF